MSVEVTSLTACSAACTLVW